MYLEPKVNLITQVPVYCHIILCMAHSLFQSKILFKKKQQENKNQETARCLIISFRSKPLHGMEINFKPDFHLERLTLKKN